MRFIIQRTTSSSVSVDGKVIGEIGVGLTVFIGISENDTKDIADKLLNKLINLRIFEDENGKSNLSLDAVNGALLLISQFTLYADCSRGNRPSYIAAGKPEMANELYEYIITQAKTILGDGRVATGSFGADMKVSILNDGPFTIIYDSDDMIK